MKLGRRIYYDVFNGVPLVDTGQHVGNTRRKTVEEDVASYPILGERTRESFDYLDLPYDYLSQDFHDSQGNFKVNIDTKQLVFDYPDINNPEAPPVYQKPLSEQIKDLETKTDQAVMELTMIIAMGGMA